MSARDKLLHQICARLDESTIEELDDFVREREREARAPLSRSLGIREILRRWADDRRTHRSRPASRA